LREERFSLIEEAPLQGIDFATGPVLAQPLQAHLLKDLLEPDGQLNFKFGL
jgi:hypothetical protein